MSTTATPSNSIVLYVWPAGWGLPSIDPLCLAALLYLQLTIPGSFSISECNDPDRSPSGQLPFLTHEEQAVASFPAIVKYVAGLKRTSLNRHAHLDAPLTRAEKAQSTAWCTFVQSKIGDLVSTMLYSVPANWEELTHPTLVSMLSVPQRYYVPARIRACYQQRLEASGLWVSPVPEQQPPKPFKQEQPERPEPKSKTFQRAFEKEKALDVARSGLDILSRLLGDKPYFFHADPTTLDILVAAHLLLLLRPKFPDAFLQDLLSESYPALGEHAHRIYSHAYSLPPPLAQSSKVSIWSLVPQLPSFSKKREPSSPEEVQFRKLRWGFFGFALGSVFAYFAVVGSPIRIVLMQKEQLDGTEEGDDTEGVDGDEDDD